MAEEGTPNAVGASTDPMAEEGTPSAAGASTDHVAEEGTPNATEASTDGGPLHKEVADEQSVTSDREARPAGTPSARKGEASDKLKSPHNSSTREEELMNRTKSPCRRKGMTKKGTGPAAPRPIFVRSPRDRRRSHAGRACQTQVPGLEDGRNPQSCGRSGPHDPPHLGQQDCGGL